MRAILVLLALAAPAIAQPAKKPTPAQLDEARAHFKAAETAKAKGDYKTAAVEYLAAYERFEDPEFFFDVAEVYKLAGDEQNALNYYQKYIELDPTGRGAAQARAAADELRRAIAAKEDAAKHAAEAEAKRKADEEAKRKAAEGQVKPAEPPVDESPEQPASGGRTLRIAGIATGVAGAAAIGVGVAFGLKARSISDEATSWDTFDQARYDEGKAANRNMIIFTAAGGAALVTGGVLYYLGYRARVAPAIGPDQVGVTATARF
jgi:tetratricopeptide (TPR) repeat protein